MNFIILLCAALDYCIYGLGDSRSAQASCKAHAGPEELAFSIGELVWCIWRVVWLLLRTLWVGRSKTARKKSAEETTHRGHADAEDADVCFKNRPVCGRNVVVCGICGIGELDEGLEANNRDDGGADDRVSFASIWWEGMLNVQCAHTKHQDNQELLLPAECESQQLGYRHNQDYNIESDVDTSMSPGKDMEVDACARVFAIPVCPDV